MKNSSMAVVAAVLMCGLVQAGFAQGRQGRGGSPAPPTITTLAGDVQADWTAQKELFVNAADAMPTVVGALKKRL